MKFPKLSKNEKIFVGFGSALPVLVVGLVAYQLFAGSPLFVNYANEDISFSYPRWNARANGLVAAENPLSRAGVAVERIEANGLPLASFVPEIKERIATDRTVLSEKIESNRAEFELSGTSAKGEALIFVTALPAGSGIYVFTAYSASSTLASNQKVFKTYFGSIKLKKDPPVAKIDLEGTVIKASGATILAYDNDGQEIYLSFAEGAKVFGPDGETTVDKIAGGMRFAAEGEFVPGSKTQFKAKRAVFF